MVLLDSHEKPVVIAEISGNHGGSLEKAKSLVDESAKAGADYVKLQTYKPETITVKGKDSRFRIKSGLWKGYNLHDLYSKAMTPWEWHKPLFDYAEKIGIKLFSSPFDETAVQFLEQEIDPELYKIASFELNHYPLLQEIGKTRKPVIASIGVSSYEVIEKGINCLRGAGCPEIILLHCVSEYPAKPEDFYLREMPLIKEKYQTHYGYSGTKVQIYNDDTDSLETPLANEELCVSRTGSWEYVPPIRYGVFDSNGNRISFNAFIDPNDPNQVVQSTLQQAPLTAQYNFDTTNTLWLNDPTIKIFNAGWLGSALQCKKIEDGTHFGNGLCPGTTMADIPNPTVRIVRIDGEDYQNFPLFDIPEGTVLTVDGGDQDGEEYYVRHLGVNKVYPAKPQGDADCDSLTIQPSEDTPDHTFFNYPTIDVPRVGAVLVNGLENNPTKDIAFSGQKWIATNDDDGDGYFNSIDMFPIDPLRNKDSDFDGIEDSEDGNVSPFNFNWPKHLDKTMFSAYEKNKQN